MRGVLEVQCSALEASWVEGVMVLMKEALV